MYGSRRECGVLQRVWEPFGRTQSARRGARPSAGAQASAWNFTYDREPLGDQLSTYSQVAPNPGRDARSESFSVELSSPVLAQIRDEISDSNATLRGPSGNRSQAARGHVGVLVSLMSGPDNPNTLVKRKHASFLPWSKALPSRSGAEFGTGRLALKHTFKCPE